MPSKCASTRLPLMCRGDTARTVHKSEACTGANSPSACRESTRQSSSTALCIQIKTCTKKNENERDGHSKGHNYTKGRGVRRKNHGHVTRSEIRRVRVQPPRDIAQNCRPCVPPQPECATLERRRSPSARPRRGWPRRLSPWPWWRHRCCPPRWPRALQRRAREDQWPRPSACDTVREQMARQRWQTTTTTTMMTTRQWIRPGTGRQSGREGGQRSLTRGIECCARDSMDDTLQKHHKNLLSSLTHKHAVVEMRSQTGDKTRQFEKNGTITYQHL